MLLGAFECIGAIDLGLHLLTASQLAPFFTCTSSFCKYTFLSRT